MLYIILLNQSQRIDDIETEISYTDSSPKKAKQFDRYTAKKIYDKLYSFFEFHEQMNFTLERNLDLMRNFLQNFDFSHECPVEEFVSNNSLDIYDSWIFNNINFEKLKVNKLIDDENFPNIMKMYIYQDTTNKFKNICVKKMKNNDKNLEFDLQLISENEEILEKLIFKEIDTNDFKSLFRRLSETNVNLESLKIIKILNSNLQNLDSTLDKQYLPNFKNIEKVIFKNNLMNFRLIDSMFYKNFHLKILSFKKCSLCNIYMSNIYKVLINLKTLEKLDLSYNHFTVFDVEVYQPLTPIIFENLEVLNLKHNNLYSIKINNFFPNLKHIDLSSNNFCLPNDIIFYQKLYSKKCLITANKNQYLINRQKSLSNYIYYLIDILSDYNYSLTRLDLSYINEEIVDLFNEGKEKSSNFFGCIVINKNIQYNIKKLNLSHGNIYTSTLITFFYNNPKLVNLKVIILRNNNITDDFIDNFLTDSCLKSLEYIEYIDLSDNYLKKIITLSNIYKLIYEKKHLKKIKLNFNELEILLNNYILIINSNSEVIDEDLDVLKKFIKNMKEMIKRCVSLVFSKLIEKNITDYLKKNNLEKIFIFE